MKLVVGLCAMAALIGVALLWETDGNGSLRSVGMVAGLALGAIVVAGVVAIWLRNRRRRAMSDMRDSALW
jgi:hypothetical protein